MDIIREFGVIVIGIIIVVRGDIRCI